MGIQDPFIERKKGKGLARIRMAVLAGIFFARRAPGAQPAVTRIICFRVFFQQDSDWWITGLDRNWA
jgi:hypothetical protein